MNRFLKMFLNLTVLGALAGFILAGVYKVANPMILKNKERELKAAIFTVLPEARDYRALKKGTGKEELVVYVGLDEARRPVGVAFKADGNGFAGNVGVMVGLGLDYEKLEGIEILEQLETPGLGDRIRGEEFKEQFRGVEVRPKVEYIKYRKPEKPNQIQAITGATISSDTVVKNINNAVGRVTGLFPAEEVTGADYGVEAEGAEEAAEGEADLEALEGNADEQEAQGDGGQ